MGGAGAGAPGGARVWASVWARCREEGEAWSAVLYGGSLTVPRAKAAGTRGPRGPWGWCLALGRARTRHC